MFVGLSLILGLLLRFWQLTSKSLWLDEIWSVTVAGMPWHSLLWSIGHHDPNMGLYHAILHVWITPHSDEFCIRALSALFGTATIPLVYVLGRMLFDVKAGLLAGLLFAVNLFHIQYSQEARSYSLWVFLCTLSSILFARYVTRGRTIDWVLYCTISVLGVYTHIYACLVIAAHLGSLLLLDRRPSLRALLIGMSGIGVFSLPVLFLIFERARSPFVPLGWVPQPSVRRVYDLFYAISGNANFYGIEVAKLATGKVLLAISFLGVLLTLMAFARQWRIEHQSYETWRQGFVYCCLFAPIVLALCVSLRMPLFLNRYFLICVPWFCLLTARGLTMLRQRWLFASALGVFMLCELAALVQYFRYRAVYGEWRTATHAILSEAQPGDALVFSIAHGRLLFDFYSNQFGAHLNNVDELYPDLSREYTDPKALGYYPAPSDRQLAGLVSHRRVWLVLYPDDFAPATDISRLFRSRLASRFSRVETHKFDMIIVCLYSHPDPAAPTLGNALAESSRDSSPRKTPQTED
jgi:4-amino-4-deoxy-L-arabinose transferase-like glycosyltransferase